MANDPAFENVDFGTSEEPATIMAVQLEPGVQLAASAFGLHLSHGLTVQEVTEENSYSVRVDAADFTNGEHHTRRFRNGAKVETWGKL